jgi:chlorite dismutase
MEQREPPLTAEGSFVLHDFRTVDWDAWRDAPEREREQALEDGIDFLVHREHAARSESGQSALYSIMGHKADLCFLHRRPTMRDLDRIERRFEDTALAAFTERTTSYVEDGVRRGRSE